ncbi:MAG: hypothetical protein H7329_04415 [Opitutaceae bacterium]|nr:hypothetical protein [Cytophagales bacterium]
MKKLVHIVLSVVILIIFIEAFKPFFKNLSDFNGASDSFIRNDSLLLSSNSGRQILPLNVQTCLHLLDSLHSKNYFIYGSFPQVQVEFYQRMQESAWPVRNDSSSRLFFGFPEELNKVAGLKVLYNKDNFCVGAR